MNLRLDGFSETEVLGYVLAGLERRHAEIMAQIEGLSRQMGGRRVPAAVSAAPAPQKHVTHRISAEGRERIAEAQRKRWAKAHRAAKRAAKTGNARKNTKKGRKAARKTAPAAISGEINMQMPEVIGAAS